MQLGPHAQAARSALLRLEEQFSDEASARVLRDVMGLATESAGAAGGSAQTEDAVIQKRQRTSS